MGIVRCLVLCQGRESFRNTCLLEIYSIYYIYIKGRKWYADRCEKYIIYFIA